jgi:hypothetical protein
MCTVTFVPVKQGCLITSNRDEKIVRKAAQPPRLYRHGTGAIVYPKDADAGGTWIAMKQNGDAAVLLNGGFKKHIANPPYRKSRGLVFIDIVEQEMPVEAFTLIHLDNIEPFTLILFVDSLLFECRWDGKNKHIRPLQHNRPHIWSSATLYEGAVIKKREQWFDEWLVKNAAPTPGDILNFHRFGGDGDARNDINMNRDGIYFTVSITVMHLTKHKSSMHYLDMRNNKTITSQVNVNNCMAV